MSTRGGVRIAGAFALHVGRELRAESFAVLGRRICCEARDPFRVIGMFGNTGRAPDLADDIRWYPRARAIQRALPSFMGSMSASNAHSSAPRSIAGRYRADSGRNCACPSPEISMMFARHNEARVLSRSRFQPALVRAVRHRPVDDRLIRRDGPPNRGRQKKMAPDAAPYEIKQPTPETILVDEVPSVIAGHDRVSEIVDALFFFLPNDAEAGAFGPVFARRNDLALRERNAGKRPSGGTTSDASVSSGQLELPAAGQRQRVAQGPAAEVPQWVRTASRQPYAAIDCCVTNFSFRFGSPRHDAPLGVRQSRSAPLAKADAARSSCGSMPQGAGSAGRLIHRLGQPA